MQNGRPSEEESIALRSEVQVDVNMIASDYHAVVSIDHCRHGVEPSRRRNERRVAAVSLGSVRTRGSAQHAFSIFIRAVTSTFRALGGTAINGDPGSKLADYIPITESQAASVLGVGADATQMHDFDHTVLFADIDVGKVLGVGWR